MADPLTLKDVMEFAPSQALLDVIVERDRHQTAEGWTYAHDDEHINAEMAQAGAAYALNAVASIQTGDDNPARVVSPHWPASWGREWWKPKDARRDLVRAAALLIAEIERIDRAEDRKV